MNFPVETNSGSTGKKRHILLLCFFILLTLLALAALHEKYSTGTGSFFRTGKKSSIKSFDPLKVKRIELSWNTNKVTLLLHKDDFWHIEERNMSLASASRVSELLHLFSSIRILKELDAPTPDVLKKLSLVEKPDKKEAALAGIKAVLKDDSGRELFKIILGSGHYPPVSRDTPGTVMAKGRYILVDGKVFLAAQLFESCIPLPQAYVEPLAIRNMKSALMVMYSAPQKKGKENFLSPSWAVVRNKKGQFRLLLPAKNTLDMQKFSDYSEILAKQLSFDILPGEDPTKIPLTGLLTIHLADGFSYRLGLAKRGKEELLLPQVLLDTGKLKPYSGESSEHYKARLAGAKLRFESEKRYYNGKVFHMVPGVMNKLSIRPVSTQKISSSGVRAAKKVSGKRK